MLSDNDHAVGKFLNEWSIGRMAIPQELPMAVRGDCAFPVLGFNHEHTGRTYDYLFELAKRSSQVRNDLKVFGQLPRCLPNDSLHPLAVSHPVRLSIDALEIVTQA